MKPRLTPLLLATFLATTSATTPVASASGINIHCPKQKLQVEQLPDLNLPRSGHHTFAIGDELIVMDQGKILQRGTHDELINQEGMYRDLMQSE
jgi:hypothetical protein